MLISETKSKPRVLCVDDELSVLKSLRRVLKKSGCSVDIESIPAVALDKVNNNNYDVIISDMRMPEMDGAEFLEASTVNSPDSIRILLTGYSDHMATVKAINEGKIYSYINKPWDNDKLRGLVCDAMSFKEQSDNEKRNTEVLKELSLELSHNKDSLEVQVENVNSELKSTLSMLNLANDDLHDTCETMVKVFSNLINHRLGQSKGFTQKISNHAKIMCKAMGINDVIAKDIEHAAMLYQIGKLMISNELVDKPYDSLTSEQRIEFEQYPYFGEELLTPLTHMRSVALIIRHHRESFDGSGFPAGLSMIQIPIASRILRIVVDFFELLASSAGEISVVVDYLTENAGNYYDPEIVDVFIESLYLDLGIEIEMNEHMVTIDELNTDMVVQHDIYNSHNMLLLAKGTVITDELITTLKQYENTRDITLRLRVCDNN